MTRSFTPAWLTATPRHRRRRWTRFLRLCSARYFRGTGLDESVGNERLQTLQAPHSIGNFVVFVRVLEDRRDRIKFGLEQITDFVIGHGCHLPTHCRRHCGAVSRSLPSGLVVGRGRGGFACSLPNDARESVGVNQDNARVIYPDARPDFPVRSGEACAHRSGQCGRRAPLRPATELTPLQASA